MKTYIIAAGTSKDSDLTALKSLPQFRKATTNMIMATAAVKETIKNLSMPEELSVVLGSSYGEVEVTKDFLFTLDQTGVARPFLFQNSLHNATLGFITQHFGFQGPAITVSKRYFTGETILETAMLLLEGGQSSLTLAIAVDALVPSLGQAYKEIYPPKIELSEMATAFLLANEDGLKLFPDLKPLAALNEIQYNRQGAGLSRDFYHDSNGIEKLYREISSQNPSFDLLLPKPDGACSIIKWNKFTP